MAIRKIRNGGWDAYKRVFSFSPKTIYLDQFSPTLIKGECSRLLKKQEQMFASDCAQIKSQLKGGKEGVVLAVQSGEPGFGYPGHT